MRPFLFRPSYTFFLLLTSCYTFGQTESIAKQWNKEVLNAISHDVARPTVHARNLFHTSIAMYDAWAAYEPDAKTYLIGQELHGFQSAFSGVSASANVSSDREEALSFAIYRLLLQRYAGSPGLAIISASITDLMNQLGFDTQITSTDYLNGGAAELGNYIAQQVMAYGLEDGSNEIGNYLNQFYEPINPPIEPEEPGNPSIIDPNRWQQVSVTNAIDQSGEPVVGTPPFLSPEWGSVSPFCLKEDDMEIKSRDGLEFKVYHDPGPPAYIDTTDASGLESFYKWGFMMVDVWQSHHDISDNVMWDISPKSVGNVQSYPTTQEEYEAFYDFFEGGDPGVGYEVNPITGEPYASNLVKRADYVRVLAEFWADGPNSVTPPGHWFEIYNTVSDHPLFTKDWQGQGSELNDLEYDVKVYLALGGAMHDAAIVAWGIKGYYDYIRPVSAIRYMSDKGQCSNPALPNYHPAGVPLIPGFVELVGAGDALQGANGENIGKIKTFTWKGPDYIGNPETDVAGVGWILAENWWPYQRPTFVTPPFAGYISGHSTYSRTAAEIFTLMTGDPYFPGGKSGFVVEKDDFLVFEEGPSETFEIQWATYRDASDQCSLSRIWGGIHPPVDDIPGRLIGIELGPEAFAFANDIYATQLPYVVEVEVSDTVFSISDMGQEKSFRFIFDQEINTSMTPEVNYVMNNPLEFLTLSQAFFDSDTSYTLIYIPNSSTVELDNIILSLTGVESLEGSVLKPFICRPFIIDTESPAISNTQLSTLLINDSLVENVGYFTIDIEWTEPCVQEENVAISFLYDSSNSLVYQNENSYWISSTHFHAHIAVVDLNVAIDGIHFIFDNVSDLAGNGMTLMSTSYVSLDTENPEITETVINNSILNIGDIGMGALEITINFDENMDTANLPNVEFSESAPLENSLSPNLYLTHWSSAQSFVAVYDLLPANEELYNLSFTLTNLRDAAGNMPASFLISNAFSIDTKKPEVTDATPAVSVVSDLNVGAGGLAVDIEFSEPMFLGQNPLVMLMGPDVSSSFTLDIGAGVWVDDTHYQAYFTVLDENVELNDISITVSYAKDNAQNPQAAFIVNNALILDTQNPELTTIIPSIYSITNEDVGTESFHLSLVFSEEMNALSIPTINWIPTNPAENVFSTNPSASSWLDDFTYLSVFDIMGIKADISAVSMMVSGAKDTAGNLCIAADLDSLLAIHISPDGIAQIRDENQVFVYPSPAKSGQNQFLLIDKKLSNCQLTIYSALGSVMFRQYHSTLLRGVHELHWPNLGVGTYLVSIQSDEQTLSQKVIIQ